MHTCTHPGCPPAAGAQPAPQQQTSWPASWWLSACAVSKVVSQWATGRAPGAGAQSMRVGVPIRSLAAEAVLLAWLAVAQRPLMTAPDCPGLYRTWCRIPCSPMCGILVRNSSDGAARCFCRHSYVPRLLPYSSFCQVLGARKQPRRRLSGTNRQCRGRLIHPMHALLLRVGGLGLIRLGRPHPIAAYNE